MKIMLKTSLIIDGIFEMEAWMKILKLADERGIAVKETEREKVATLAKIFLDNATELKAKVRPADDDAD